MTEGIITVVPPGYSLFTPVKWFDGMMDIIELAGRTCYKSETKVEAGSAPEFVRKIIKSGHESVIEHCVITVKIFCSRACSHQLVRHRIAAYSQESQRYCDYGKLGFQVICPPNINLPGGKYERKGFCHWVRKDDNRVQHEMTNRARWLETVYDAYSTYLHLRDEGTKPEDARFVLPNATKTEVVTTFNLRQWRHVFKDRALNPRAQWELREIMMAILEKFVELMPSVFGDLVEKD